MSAMGEERILSDDLPLEALMSGRSDLMNTIHQKTKKLATAKLPVLIQDYSRTGKEVIARLMHRSSPGGPVLIVREFKWGCEVPRGTRGETAE